ncbi:MAG TPA: hypothetical protein VLZ78_00760 [Terrimesophilobacter sp.]|nr:hypothetical protein [Terrimesophilobacter sp.]
MQLLDREMIGDDIGQEVAGGAKQLLSSNGGRYWTEGSTYRLQHIDHVPSRSLCPEIGKDRHVQWPLVDGEGTANAQRLKGNNNHIFRHTNTVNHERRERTTGELAPSTELFVASSRKPNLAREFTGGHTATEDMTASTAGAATTQPFSYTGRQTRRMTNGSSHPREAYLCSTADPRSHAR